MGVPKILPLLGSYFLVSHAMQFNIILKTSTTQTFEGYFGLKLDFPPLFFSLHILGIYTERQKKLIISAERHSLKWTPSKLIIFGLRYTP